MTIPSLPTRLVATGGLVVAVAVLGGCGQGAASAPPVVRAETTTVDLPPSYRFAPPDIAVVAGETVTWANNDHFSHSVQFLDGGLPTEPLTMEPGESVSFTFETPGVFRYLCHLHPQNMRGSVQVADR